jgi:hypothetical protein
MHTPEDFIRRFGPIEPLESANDRWRECRVPSRDYPHSGSMFAGQFWTSGYFLPGEDPASDDLPWAEIAQDVMQSRGLAEQLADVWVHSDTDSPYFPCFLRLPDGAGFGAGLKAALGWQVDPQFERSPFWGDVRVRPLPPDSDAFFWDPLDDDVIDEYFSPKELVSLRRVTAVMKDSLADLRHVTFPEAYVTYPVLWLGRTGHGSWVGLWALRVDT